MPHAIGSRFAGTRGDEKAARAVQRAVTGPALGDGKPTSMRIPETEDRPTEVVIPSDTAEGQRVQQSIVDLLEAHQFNPHDVFGIRLALEEALVNAITHGNRLDPDKCVRISYIVNSRYFHAQIEDQGPGFDPGGVPDPTRPENLERPCGRGIMLMRAFMNHVEYNGRGNCVTLYKARIQGVAIE